MDHSLAWPKSFIRTHQDKLFILLLTGGAAALRLYRLGEWSFWEDEVFVFTGKEDGFNYSFLRRSLTTDLIRQFTLSFGNDEWNARLIPALIGIFTIPVFYFLLKRTFNRRIAWMGSALLAVSTWHLYWSQNARFYISLLLFYTLASFFFFLGVEENRPRWLVLALLFFGLAVKERLLGVFLLPVAGLYILIIPVLGLQRPAGYTWRNLAIFFFPLGLVGVAFLGPYLGNLSGWYAGFRRINNNPAWLLAGVAYFTGIILPALAGAALPLLVWRKNRAALFFGLNIVLPLAAVMLLSLVQYTANRYAFLTLTSWIVLGALGLDALANSARSRLKALALVLGVILFTVPLAQDFAYFQFQNGIRGDWKAALQYINIKMEPSDQAFFANPDIAQFYLQRPALGFAEFDPEQTEQQKRRIWFVEDMNVADLYPQQLAWVKAHAMPIANFNTYALLRTFVLQVYLYTPTETGAADQNMPGAP